MGNRILVASAPHIHGSLSTQRLMLDVIIALLPALAVSVYVYGWGVLAVTAVSIGCCILFEYLIQRFLVGGKQTITTKLSATPNVIYGGDGSKLKENAGLTDLDRGMFTAIIAIIPVTVFILGAISFVRRRFM